MKKLAAIFSILVLTTICLTACAVKSSAECTTTEPENSTTEIQTETAESEIVTVDDGYMTNNNVCTQDEYEQTLFYQPISKERDGELRMGIKCTTDIYAELTIYEAQDGWYVPIFTCPAVIGKNGPGKHAEGDTKTPLGTWIIGEAYGIKEDPGTALPYTQITDDMYWCATGSHGTKYNQLIFKSDEPDADYSEDEHLIDYPGVYDYFIDLGYNAGCAPYAGNAIFLHVWRDPDHYTGGCVAVSEEDIITILQILSAGTVVTIY